MTRRKWSDRTIKHPGEGPHVAVDIQLGNDVSILGLGVTRGLKVDRVGAPVRMGGVEYSRLGPG